MTTPAQDRTEGKIDETKGRFKESLGNLIGDNKMRGEGFLDEAVGKVKQGLADVKDRVNGTADKSKSN